MMWNTYDKGNIKVVPARSAGVMDWIMDSYFLNSFSASASCLSLTLPMPAQSSHRLGETHFCFYTLTLTF